MLRSRFFWHLYGGYCILVLVFALVVGVSVSDWVTDDTRQEIRDTLNDKAVMLRGLAAPVLQAGSGSGSGSGDEAGFAARVRALGADIETRLTVIAADGRVIADSEEDPGKMEDHSMRAEIEAAARTGAGFVRRYSRTLGRDLHYAAVRVPAAGDGVLLGFARASIALSIVTDRLRHLRGLVVLGASIAALVALLIGFFVARRITAPVTAMTSVVESMAAGDYSRRAPVRSRDEIGQLAAAFNKMAAQMEARVATITSDRNTLQAILSGMIEGVVAIDTGERVMHMNAIAGDLLDVDPSRALGKRIWESSRVNEVAKALGVSLRSEKEMRTQARIVRGEEESLLEISAAPLRDGSGGLLGAVVVFHDVTELRRLELVRREFVVNASHELKTPITALRGFLETLVTDPDMPEATRRDFLRRASGQAARLSSLVTDLLRLSRLESGDPEEQVRRLDLRTVIRGAVDDLRPVAVERGVALALEFAAGEAAVLVEADEATLRLVVDNLVDNAIKYSGAEAHVVVRVSLGDGDTVVLEVEDDGIGIDRLHLDRIFERFYRIDKARSRELGGTGLGLAIVKHACGVLGAELEVRSEAGIGSTFTVRLPRVAGRSPKDVGQAPKRGGR